ncbi:MAG: imelysin family protein [Acidimicrobiales bacterium]
MLNRTRPRAVLAGLALLPATLVACGDDGASDETTTAVVETYAEGVYTSYVATLDSATAMDAAIDAFVADPTDSTLAAAKDAWIAARDIYGPTEAFRFYGGPIDDEETGPEGLINAWPLDEAYIDYVEGDATAGIVNDAETYPEITADLLVSLNEDGGEANISTGWHAIEFLLWGQDLSLDGPGERPVSDFTTADNADRRAAYLAVASDLLLVHLGDLVDAWAPDADNYRADFVALESDEALRHIITGIGELSRGELAGERMNVAYAERSQEDEHSCFSDNTVADIVGNAQGIANVVTGSYEGSSGTGLADLVAEVDEDLADRLVAEVEASVDTVAAIPSPFDQHLVDGVSDDDPGRVAIVAGMDALELQTETIVEVAEALGVTISIT